MSTRSVSPGGGTREPVKPGHSKPPEEAPATQAARSALRAAESSTSFSSTSSLEERASLVHSRGGPEGVAGSGSALYGQAMRALESGRIGDIPAEFFTNPAWIVEALKHAPRLSQQELLKGFLDRIPVNGALLPDNALLFNIMKRGGPAFVDYFVRTKGLKPLETLVTPSSVAVFVPAEEAELMAAFEAKQDYSKAFMWYHAHLEDPLWQDVPPYVRNCRELAFVVANQSPKFLGWFSREVLSDPQLARHAVEKHPSSLGYFGKEIRSNPSIVRLAVQKEPELARYYLHHPSQNDNKDVEEIIKACDHIPSSILQACKEDASGRMLERVLGLRGVYRFLESDRLAASRAEGGTFFGECWKFSGPFSLSSSQALFTEVLSRGENYHLLEQVEYPYRGVTMGMIGKLYPMYQFFYKHSPLYHFRWVSLGITREQYKEFLESAPTVEALLRRFGKAGEERYFLMDVCVRNPKEVKHLNNHDLFPKDDSSGYPDYDRDFARELLERNPECFHYYPKSLKEELRFLGERLLRNKT